MLVLALEVKMNNGGMKEDLLDMVIQMKQVRSCCLFWLATNEDTVVTPGLKRKTFTNKLGNTLNQRNGIVLIMEKLSEDVYNVSGVRGAGCS